MIGWRFLIVLLSLAHLTWHAPARSDEIRPAYLALDHVSGNVWSVIWKAPVAGGMAGAVQPEFPPFCTFTAEGATLNGPALVSVGKLDCQRDLSGGRVRLAGLDADYGDAIVRISMADGAEQVERLTAARTAVTINARPARADVAASYLVLGFEHILAGYDHVLFVVALVLLLRRFRPVLLAATGFTIAHSITLAGTTTGFMGLPQASVEALIALSIIFLAVEITRQSSNATSITERWPWAIAFAFGLLHGFGFAGALREIGLPENDVPLALLCFNLGVEAGQVVVICATLLVMACVRRLHPPLLPRAVGVASYLVGITASYWFIERIVA